MQRAGNWYNSTVHAQSMSTADTKQTEASGAATLEVETASDKLTVEVVHTTKGVPLQGLIALGMVLIFTSGMAYYYINNGSGNSGFDEEGGAGGNCGDGKDNDSGGQADRDDPDCYANPEVWEGYSTARSETNAANDPPNGQP